MAYCVYCHTNKINGKKYIGITGTKPERRWMKGEGYKGSRHFYFAIQKYGWDNFAHDIFFEGLTKEEACQKEIELIDLFKTTDERFGYNISSGGQSGAAGVKRDKELIEKIAAYHRGKKISAETRKKMSDAAKGRTFSEETKHKMRMAKLGMKIPKERVERATATKRAKGQFVVSQETKNKLHDIKPKKRVYCLETGKIYDSIQTASRELGFPATNICAVCKGKHEYHKGYHFQYADD